MKRIVCLILAVMMASLLSVSAFAAGSVSGTVEISKAVDAQGKDVSLETADSTVLLTVPVAAQIAKQDESKLAILWQKDIKASALPATLTFNVAGTDNLTLYVFHYNGTEWVIEATGKGPTVTAAFNSLSPVALVVQSDGGGEISPRTSSTGWVYVLCAAVSAAAITIGTVSVRKRED